MILWYSIWYEQIASAKIPHKNYKQDTQAMDEDIASPIQLNGVKKKEKEWL